MELDHLFVFIAPDGPEPKRLESLGFEVNVRRSHPGQGTRNVCYVFDNAYLELLWLVDEAEARSPAVGRTQLAERARWRENAASPLGIALRGYGPQAPLPFKTWDYHPPFRPGGRKVLPIAAFSDDLAQPLVFGSPGDLRPDHWPEERQSGRQRALRIREIETVEVILPAAVAPAEELQALAHHGLLKLSSGPAQGIVLTLSRDDGAPLRLSLPDCVLL
ncbi:MAG TPA: hypothetical protein EYH07_19055 [Kiloniellaceae bacterium]|nr:hypothetical protein [Kiloniellaceae bacterium]HIP80545.1 hypothetical protein [Kiloniellaceae bacterium]